MIFGPALVDAYLTESKAALYPRVILDESILDLINEDKIDYINILFQDGVSETYLQRDGDDKFYIDYILRAKLLLDPEQYINAYLPKLRFMIVEGLKNKHPDVIVKYGWQKNKFNGALETLKNDTTQLYATCKEDIEMFNSILPINRPM